ncbi:hypothetical protein EV586_101566 [Tumebacillus sp. BK434]|uniref:hypothetical protein n=1 Tax=Tumebacillus sp. BK434 TaxID=2512169 RepID=UPI00104DFB6C|nr:hypothetical protein [Tumebacillus sp. BK434]TCP59350.1 hypothetical protein EV586_101566 [Tumebacillus sp. BK434]
MILLKHRRAMIEKEILRENWIESGRIDEVAMVPKWATPELLKGHDLAGDVIGVELAGIVGIK